MTYNLKIMLQINVKYVLKHNRLNCSFSCLLTGVSADASTQNIGILVSWMLDNPMPGEAEASLVPTHSVSAVDGLFSSTPHVTSLSPSPGAAEALLVRDRLSQ